MNWCVCSQVDQVDIFGFNLARDSTCLDHYFHPRWGGGPWVQAHLDCAGIGLALACDF